MVAETTPRAVPHPPDGDIPGLNSLVTVPFLTSLVLPDTSQYLMPLVGGYDLTGEFTSVTATGMLRKIIMPTGGSIEWQYRGESTDPVDAITHHYGFPLTSSARGYLRTSIGVRQMIVTLV